MILLGVIEISTYYESNDKMAQLYWPTHHRFKRKIT